MAMQAKETPAKSCEWCGTQFERKRVGKSRQLECVSNFLRRKFCSVSCSVSSQHAKPKTPEASRKVSMKLNSGCCEACGSTTETVVHHVDGNPLNNLEPNLQTLCSPCHSFWHGMLRRIGRSPDQRMPRLIG